MDVSSDFAASFITGSDHGKRYFWSKRCRFLFKSITFVQFRNIIP